MTTKTWPVPRVLRNRDAALYLAGVMISGFGTSALWLVSGVWVKDLTGSNGLAALCLLAMWAPTLAGPLLGTLADRFRRKPLLIGTNVLLAVLLPVLLTVDSPDRVWLILTVLFVYGATGVVVDAAESALVAGAVTPALLGDFNGLRMAITEGMKLVAPLAGAGLYAVYGGPGVALLDALTFALAALLYAGLRVRESRPEPHGHRRTAKPPPEPRGRERATDAPSKPPGRRRTADAPSKPPGRQRTAADLPEPPDRQRTADSPSEPPAHPQTAVGPPRASPSPTAPTTSAPTPTCAPSSSPPLPPCSSPGSTAP